MLNELRAHWTFKSLLDSKLDFSVTLVEACDKREEGFKNELVLFVAKNKDELEDRVAGLQIKPWFTKLFSEDKSFDFLAKSEPLDSVSFFFLSVPNAGVVSEKGVFVCWCWFS